MNIQDIQKDTIYLAIPHNTDNSDQLFYLEDGKLKWFYMLQADSLWMDFSHAVNPAFKDSEYYVRLFSDEADFRIYKL